MISGTSQEFKLGSFPGGSRTPAQDKSVGTYQVKCSNSKFYTSLKMEMVLSFDIMWGLYETVQLPGNAQDSITVSVNNMINYNSVREQPHYLELQSSSKKANLSSHSSEHHLHFVGFINKSFLSHYHGILERIPVKQT